jgi:hypothetical protein
MLDVDSFLPPVFERYHQILLPVLELVSVVASSLGLTSNGAVVEALSFLNAHRETILGLLRDSVGRIPLSTVKELHLLASIFTQVLPTVEQQDLVRPLARLRCHSFRKTDFGSRALLCAGPVVRLWRLPQRAAIARQPLLTP